jgi:hypothetical protein
MVPRRTARIAARWGRRGGESCSAETGEVGRHHLVDIEGGTEAAVGPHEAEGCRVSDEVAGRINHLVHGDALRARSQITERSFSASPLKRWPTRPIAWS